MNKYKKLFFPIACLFATLGIIGCDGTETSLKTPLYETGLAANVMENTPVAEQFPIQYETYKKNDEHTVMTEYKGSVHYRKNDNVNPLPKGYKYAQPYLKNLWLGYPFMYEYNEARGHTYALEDVAYIDRINRYKVDGKGDLPGTCWNCKTPKIEEFVAEYGDGFWKMDANFFRDKLDPKEHSVSCATCHDTSNMALDLYSIPLKEYLEQNDQVFEKLSRNEQRSLVCAQCHVEYYFTHPDNGVAAKPVFPWANGFDPADMYEYYKNHGAKDGPFVDFVHAASGVPIIKAQHPEYETWINGPHGAAGVSCADCHMPYEKTEGKKASSHWWTSPLKDPNLTACRQCHSDKTATYLKERVEDTQKKTFDQLLKAQEESVRAHEAIRLAKNYAGERSPDYDKLIAEAVELTRKGQFFWDYISAENSVGFHNPTKALTTLMSSFEYSSKAVQLAALATNGAILPEISGDIYAIVPPILEHSRELQQSQEHLDTHKWLKLLPKLPDVPIQWDGFQRISQK